MVNAGDAFPAGEDYLVRRIKDVERRVSENASSIPRSFQTTVDALTAQIAAISALQANSVTPAVLSTSAGAYTTTTTFGVICTLSFSVPAGFTRALITAQSVCNVNSSASTSEIGYSKVAINGVDGMVTSGQWPTATALGMLPANSAANLTGLSGGTVTVTLSVRVQYGPASGGFASLNATALFLR